MGKENQLDRRSFIKGGIAAGLAGVTGAMVAGCSPQPASDKSGQPNVDANEGISASEMTQRRWNFQIPPDPIDESRITKTETADIIVVGAGTSGLATATAAAENGATVIVISASKGNVSRGGSNHAVYSKTMAAKGIERYDVDKFFRSQLIAAGYNVDQSKWWKFANNSEEAMNWVIDIMDNEGIETVIEASPQLEPTDPMFCPLASHSWINDKITDAGSGQQLLVDTLAKRAQAQGAILVYEMVAEQLEKDSQGRISGVLAHGIDSTDSYTRYVGTSGIVLATGDFSADKDMMQCYCPGVLDLLNPDAEKNSYDVGFTWGGLFRGDGHKMGLWAGAAWQKTYPNAAMTLAVGTSGPINRTMGAHRGLLVNKEGNRYSNENANGVFAGTVQRHQPEMLSYALWGTNYAKDAAPWYRTGMVHGSEPIAPEQELANWKEGQVGVLPQTVVHGDTIDEVIDQLGLPKTITKATVERYNELCAKGVDEDFHKPAEHMIGITEGPFYGAVGDAPKFLTVLGGLRTNQNMQVCNENDEPLPGLFNVGTMVGDYYSNIYNFMIEGNNLGATCITFGYVTGRDLALGRYN